MSGLPSIIKNDAKYLQFYWDLASDDDSVRWGASVQLVEHLKAITDQDKRMEYRAYTLRRLIRGLSSPRDCARQGFAVTLTEVLKLFDYEVDDVLSLLDEHAQTSGSAKGSEERDGMFGKLFGYVAIVRAQLLFSKANIENAEEQLIELLTRIIELHQMKMWIQESTIEILLSIVDSAAVHATGKHSIISTETLTTVVSALVDLTNTSDFTANNENELSILLALQRLASQHDSVQKVLMPLLKEKNIPSLTIEHMDVFEEALLHSTNKFPKCHRVWDYFMGFFLPMNSERDLIRSDTLNDAQQTALQRFVQFVDTHMWQSSKEKRATAQRLAVRMSSLVSADALPLALSEQCVRSFLLCRSQRSNLLFDYCGGILKDLVQDTQACGDAQRSLALLWALTQHCGVQQFDQRTQTTTAQSLLASLPFDAVQEFVQLLCSAIATRRVNGDSEQQQQQDADDEDRNSTAIAAVHSLSAVARLAMPVLNNTQANSKPSSLLSEEHKQDVLVAVLTAFSRIVNFVNGKTVSFHETADTSDEKKEKKSSKKDKKEKKKEAAHSQVKLVEALSFACVQTLEQGAAVEENSAVLLLSAQHLRSLCSELALKTGSLAESNDARPQAVSSLTSLLRVLANVRRLATQPDMVARYVPEASAEEEDDEDDHMSLNVPLEQLVEMISNSLQSLAAIVTREVEVTVDSDSEANKEVGSSAERLTRFAGASLSLLSAVASHSLAGVEVQRSVVLQTAALLRAMAERFLQREGLSETELKEMDELEAEEDDEEDAAELALLEVCAELFALPSEQTVKALRDAAKKVWSTLFVMIGEDRLSPLFLDALVGQVTEAEESSEQALQKTDSTQQEAEEHDDEEGDEEDDGDRDDDNEGDEEDEDELEKFNALQEQKQQQSAPVLSNKKARVEAVAQREEAEEEVIVSEDQMVNFLMEDDASINAELGIGEEDSDDDGEPVLQHNADADDALIKFMQMKKDSRKQGMVAAKRKQLLLRSRLLDVLEVLVNRARQGPFLFSLFVPLLLGVKKLTASKVVQDIPEGKTLALRLHSLVLNQLCKKKFTLRFGGDEELEEECKEELESFATLSLNLVGGAHSTPALRALALEAVVSVARAVIGSDSATSQQQLLSLLVTLTEKFLAKKRSGVPRKWLEDLLLQRFPHFALRTIMPMLCTALCNEQVVKTPSFVRGEILEILSVVLKRMHTFDKPTKESLRPLVKDILNAVHVFVDDFLSSVEMSTALSTTAEKSDKKSKKGQQASAQEGKKLRGMIQTVKSMVDNISKLSNSDQSKSQDIVWLDSTDNKTLTALLKSIQKVAEFAIAKGAALAAVTQLSTQAVQSLTKTIAATSSSTSSVSAAATDSKKSKKKHSTTEDHSSQKAVDEKKEHKDKDGKKRSAEAVEDKKESHKSEGKKKSKK